MVLWDNVLVLFVKSNATKGFILATWRTQFQQPVHAMRKQQAASGVTANLDTEN